MSRLLDGRLALVTGASRGIGAAVARALAEHGADSCLLGRDRVALRAVADQVEQASARSTSYVLADMADPVAIGSAVDDAIDRLGGMDILVNNAGTIERADAAELTLEQWTHVVDVNLRGTFLTCQHAFPALSAHGGSIINVSSLSGRFGIRRAAAYGASKGGVVQLTRALALEWARHGIRVNAVAPGYVKTDFTWALHDDPQRAESIVARIPMGRWASPEDVAGSVVFFASELAAYVTGQVLYADGGYSCDG